jgi:hypothetical protein
MLNIGPWIGGGVAIALFLGAWWAIDAYGDYRSLQCHSAYARAAGQTNEDVGNLNDDEAQAETVAAALVAKGLEAAKALPSVAPASKEQALALSGITE